ncbi:MAG: hypothetical protein V7K97_27750 [Nostoc sp.]
MGCYRKGDGGTFGILDSSQMRSQIITFGSAFREGGKTLAKGNNAAYVTLM